MGHSIPCHHSATAVLYDMMSPHVTDFLSGHSSLILNVPHKGFFMHPIFCLTEDRFTFNFCFSSVFILTMKSEQCLTVL